MEVTILEDRLSDALKVYNRIPEFDESKHIPERLAGKEHLILVLYENSVPAALKIGYAMKDHFYSWIGGVLPQYRRKGYARMLAEYQETWLRGKGYAILRMKTRNKFPAMLCFAVENGFQIIDLQKSNNPRDNRIWLEKKL